jgi:hypothetical protein
MKKVIRLTESDLVRLINRVISEQSTEGEDNVSSLLRVLDKFPSPSPFLQYFLFDMKDREFRRTVKLPLEELHVIFLNKGIKESSQLENEIQKLQTYRNKLQNAYSKLSRGVDSPGPEKELIYKINSLEKKMKEMLQSSLIKQPRV